MDSNEIKTPCIIQTLWKTTTMHCNDTLVDTPFQLISDFFHVSCSCCEHAEQTSSRGVLGGGGGGGGGVNRLAKHRRGEQQASWFTN